MHWDKSRLPLQTNKEVPQLCLDANSNCVAGIYHTCVAARVIFNQLGRREPLAARLLLLLLVKIGLMPPG